MKEQKTGSIIDQKKQIGKRIKHLRRNIMDMNQKEFVIELGFGRANLSKIENGQIYPNGQFFAALYYKFNVSIDWIISGKGEIDMKNRTSNFDLSVFEGNMKDVALMLKKMQEKKDILHGIMHYFFSQNWEEFFKSTEEINYESKRRRKKNDT